MKNLIMMPDGWPCTYEECRPGHFVWADSLCLKSEYGGDGFCDSGEYFCGPNPGKEARDAIMVQPVCAEWREE